MILTPKTVKRGEVIRASGYNDIVRSIRDLGRVKTPVKTQALAGRQSKPFEVIEVSENEEAEVHFKIKPGYLINGDDYYHCFVEKIEGDGFKPLDAVPLIKVDMPEVDAPKWLAVDTDTCKLFWAGSDDYKSNVTYITRFELKEEGEETKLHHFNIHPQNVLLGPKDPFRVTVWNDPSPALSGSAPYECTVTITPGFVKNILPMASEDKVYKFISVSKPEGENLEAEETPVFYDIPQDEVFYIKIETDSTGKVTSAEVYHETGGGDPTAFKESTHYQPAPASVDGEYYFPIARIKRHNFSDAYYQFYAEQLWTGDIVFQPNLFAFENVGGKIEVFKEFDADSSTYKFRTVEQLEGRGQPIIKALDPGDAEADPPIAPEEQGDTIQFKSIAEKVTQPQIRVTADGEDVIQVEGNGYDSAESAVRKFSIDVKDGLVTSFLKDAVGDGWWGDVTIYYTAAGASTTELSMTFEDGLLVSVFAPGIGDVAGTEGSPGVANIGIVDT